MPDKCDHNRVCRHTDGFHCYECDTFYGMDTPTYRSGELLTSIWMVLNNINADLHRAGKDRDSNVDRMKDKIGIGYRPSSSSLYYEGTMTDMQVYSIAMSAPAITNLYTTTSNRYQ